MTRHLLHAAHGVAGHLRWLETPAPIDSVVQRIVHVLEGYDARQLGTGKADAIAIRDVLPSDRLIREQLRRDLEGVIAGIHELDALRSMAQATEGRGLVFPAVRDDSTSRVAIRGLCHPFLDQAIRNDVNLEEDGSLLFLTGPNMAGKTTYIRGAAICVYLAHVGLGVPAERMELSPFDALFSSINTIDTVRLGYSYYFSEVQRVKEAALLMRDGHRVFAIFDELFKGTNVRDAYDASLAVLSGFARVRRSAIIVSSHLSELADELKTLGSVRFRYFSAEIRDGEPLYSYRLHAGVSAQRLGMVLLERERVLELLGRPSTSNAERSGPLPHRPEP
jgi:DNA mismatch repair protein MutS